MVGKTEPHLMQDRVRFEIITTYCGCLPCLLMAVTNVHATIQHVVEGKRLGHQFTYGSCTYHHLGIYHPPYPSIERLGPSLFDGRKPFEEHFGSERSLVELATRLDRRTRDGVGG